MKSGDFIARIERTLNHKSLNMLASQIRIIGGVFYGETVLCQFQALQETGFKKKRGLKNFTKVQNL